MHSPVRSGLIRFTKKMILEIIFTNLLEEIAIEWHELYDFNK
jgi:hypothetical protein